MLEGVTESDINETTSTTAETNSQDRAALEEGAGTSPNTSGIVTGTLTTTSPLTGNLATAAIKETVTLDISGNQANYEGGYIEIRLENGSALSVTPSPLTGVTYQVTQDGTAKVIKASFAAGSLQGGAYYSLVFTYKFNGVDNWGNVVDTLNDNNFNIQTTATFYDKDGLVVKDLGYLSHQFTETYNGVSGGTYMNSNQIVGYDRNNDGLVDDNPGKVSYYIYTGSLQSNGSVRNDYYAPGTGVFDGRMVNGLGTSGTGSTVIDAVSSYTYYIPLKSGLTLSAESIAAGWTEDETGYHLTVDRSHNPIGGDATSNLNNASNYVPLILDVVAGTPVSAITSSKNITVTGTYTKENGETYSNTTTIPYSVTVPTSVPTTGVIALTHTYQNDTDIIASYGRTNYNTSIGLTNVSEVDSAYDLTDYTFKVTTNNDNEFFNTVELSNRYSIVDQIRAGGQLDVYDDATGQLLHSYTKDNITSTSFSIDENVKVKTLRYAFSNIVLEKNGTSSKTPSTLLITETTFFDDWSTIYRDTSINQLTSSTTATLTNDTGTINLSRTATGVLDRTTYEIYMEDNPTTLTATSRSFGAGFRQTYVLNQVGTARVSKLQEQNTAAYLADGQLYQAYLVDPNLKLGSQSTLAVIYNWNNTGKDLYYETTPVTASSDPIAQNVVQIANNYVKNGTYDILTIGFWAEEDPSLVPTDGIDLTAPINGINITAANSTTRTFSIVLNTSESSGVLSQVKSDSDTNYSYNTNGREAQDLVDFKVSYSNVSKVAVEDVTVITSLPRNNDKQLDTTNKNRNSQFSVYLTDQVTAPSGWTAVYTTVNGNSTQMEAGTWLTADQVTDWETITAIKYISTAPIIAGATVDFYIDNAVIGGDALQGEKAYLSSASSVGTAAYIESNNVLIEMASEIPDGTLTIRYVDEANNVIATEKVLSNDIKSDYDVSDNRFYYPTYITGTDDLPYVYVRTDDSSAPNLGTYSETPQVITHVYKLVTQIATFTYIDITDEENPEQLGEIDTEIGNSGQDILYDTTTRINQYLKKGYEVVSNDYEDGTKFDTNRDYEQPFTIELRQRVVEIPETAIVPNQPVDPSDPNSPVWPETVESVAKDKPVVRIIDYKYIDESGETAAETVTQAIVFTRTASVNLVTGDIIYGNWTPSKEDFSAVESPSIAGYTPNITSVSDITVDVNSDNSRVVVIYTPDEQTATETCPDETTDQVIEEENLPDGSNDVSTDDSTVEIVNTDDEQVANSSDNNLQQTDELEIHIASKSNVLPNTGEERNNSILILGLLLSGLGLAIVKKKENEA